MNIAEFKRVANKVNPLDFLNYQDYFAAVYKEHKEWYRGKWSYVQFTKSVGLGQCNTMLLVIQGKRNLSKDSIKKISKALGVVGVKREYLECLVTLQVAKDESERANILEELWKIRAKAMGEQFSGKKLQFFSDWIHVAVLEILRLKEDISTEEQLLKRIRHKVRLDRVKKSVVLLKELGMIEKEHDTGFLKVTTQSISTGSEVRGLVFLLYHRQVIELALTSLTQDLAAKRDISAITIPINVSQLAEVKELTKNFRRQLAKLSEAADSAEEVYQVNIQVFPLTQKGENENDK